MKKNKLDPKFDNLMAPRFKVVSKYPDSPFRLNAVINFKIATKRLQRLYNMKYTYSTKRDLYTVIFFQQYPAIFQPIPFWEDRKPVDFPVPFFVRSETNNVFKITKVEKREGGKLYFEDNVHNAGFAIWMTKEMITEDEYNRSKEFSDQLRARNDKFGIKQYQQK